MATNPRPTNQRSTTITVAVVGITSSTSEHIEGAGKSCLCNRFVRPHSDHYYTNHPYIVNHSEFGNSVINSTHFLYWGEKLTSLEDSSEVCFRVIEHTEFVEDMSLKPFPSQKAYHKRILSTKLQSGGKLQYVAPNQLTLPEEYTDVSRFPDKAVQVDGFVLCIDGSTSFKPKDIQHDMALKLISSIQSTKKPYVIALTKCDKADIANITETTDTISKFKKVPQIIEVSSHDNVNIDLCFLFLAHLVDSRKPRSRVIPYSESLLLLKQRIKRNEASFNEMLSRKLTDCTLSIYSAISFLKSEPEWLGVAQFSGDRRCERLIELRLAQLKDEAIEKQLSIYIELIPSYLDTLLPAISMTDTYEMCMSLLQQNENFGEYFVNIEDWKSEDYLFTFSNKVPLSVLLNEGKSCLEDHIAHLQKEQRKDLALANIKSALENANDLQPGLKVMNAMEQLGMKETADLLPQDTLQKVFQDRMTAIEHKCADDIHELLLERLDLFHEYTPDTKEIVEKLQDEPRMKMMELAPIRRDGIIVKHISTLEVLKHGPYYTPAIVPKLAEICPNLKSFQCSHWSQTDKDSTDEFDLAILGHNTDETLILRSDIMNTCGGADSYEVNDKSYKLNISCYGSEEFTDLSTDNFTPQGTILLVNSMSSLEWIGSMCTKLFLTSSNGKYRGMPCVLLVVDKELVNGNNKSDLHVQSKQLSIQLQCVLVIARPSELPNRIVNQDSMNNVLSSLFDAVTLTTEFLSNGPKLEEDGLNFDVFSLPGDPIDVSALAAGLCSQQLVHFDEDKRYLYMKIALEKQHRVALFSFFSTINAKDFGSHPVLGFIIIYSAKRKASLAAVRWLIPRLHDIPVLLVAITNGDHSSPLILEGENLTKKYRKMQFIVCQNELEVKHISNFCSNCFFSRFTTWSSQQLSDEVVARLCKRKGRQLPRNQPELPSAYSTSTLPHSLSARHSVAIISDELKMKDKFATMSKSMIKSHFQQQQSEEEDPLYTSPLDIKREVMSPTRFSMLMKSTPELTKPISSKSPSHFSVPNNSDYAVVPDMSALNKLDTLTRGQRPSFVESEDDDIEEEEPIELEDSELIDGIYSDPRNVGGGATKPTRKLSEESPPPIPAREKLYNHLTPRTKRKMQQQGINISSLNSLNSGSSYPESVYSLASHESSSPPKVGVATPPTGVYSLCGSESSTGGNEVIYSLAKEAEVQDMYSYATTPNHHPQQQLYSYATVDSSKESTPEALYAEPEIHNSGHWRQYNSRTPSPCGSVSPVSRSSPKPPLLPKPRGKKPEKPKKPEKFIIKKPTVVADKSPGVMKRAGTFNEKYSSRGNSLESNYQQRRSTSPLLKKHQLQHVTPVEDDPDLIYALPIKTSQQKVTSATYHEATPPSGDMDDDDEEDEKAPPIPERNYSWSDIEEDDEDLFMSDDEFGNIPLIPLAGPLAGSPAGSIGVYATVTDPKSSHLAPPTRLDIRHSIEVQEIEAIYMNFNQLRQQLSQQQNPQESIYDTLEKVVEAVNNPSPAPSSATLPALSKNALKLMQKMEKKASREAERRKKAETKRLKKEEEEAKKALKRGKKTKKKQRKRYFGTSLPLVVDEDGVPALVKSCATYIEKNGLQSEGVYRVSGKKEEIMKFQEIYDRDNTQDIECNDICVNAVTGIMKNFFKLLPFPLITEDILPRLLEIPGSDPSSQKQKMYQELSKLPKENLQTLSYLVKHLNIVQKHNEVNKMTASNLAIVFWPTLMRPPLADLADPGKQLGFQLIMSKIIEDPDLVPNV